MMARFAILTLLLLAASTRVLSYKLSPDDGQADIGAYHVQPGRCTGVERRLGRTKYNYFFYSDPFLTSFSPGPSSYSATSSDSTPPSPGDADGAGSGIEQMDATSLCAFNPELTEGYGGGFDEMELYLVYSRCLYGTDSMRVLCGTTDGRGKPTNTYNLVQATSPSGGKDKDPKVVAKLPKGDPTKDQTHVDNDGTIAGEVLTPTAAGGSDAKAQPATPPPKEQQNSAARPDTTTTKDGHLPFGSGATPGAGVKHDLTTPAPPTAANPMGNFVPLSAGHGPTNPSLPPETPGQKPPKPLEHQKALTQMGFRKRALR
ncbi:hypothetical protein NDA16_001058 [Ustilago loliicola]|nr:hypothetical protein NDA16_001058 [Ustilago loliicola]